MAISENKSERRLERIDRGIKARTDGIYALLSWREISYLMAPRTFLLMGLLVLPVFLPEVWQRVFCLAGIYSLLAIAFDFLFSYAGMVSLGGALWMGVGGYTVGILGSEFGLPPVFSLPIGTFLGGGICTVLLLPTLRLKGIYFAIATFIYPFIISHIIEALQIAGGTFGLADLPVIENGWVVLYVMAVLLTGIFFGIRRLVIEDVGMVFRSMMENDQAVSASGISITVLRTIAVYIASCIGCLAGGYLSVLYGWVGMSFFALDFSILPIAASVIGGPGTFAGSLLGAFILVPLTEFLRPFGPMRMVGYSVILALFVVLKPEGIFPYLTRKYNQFQRWVEV
ncbi:amino acid or sugar ABC transport system, permease protein [delta proteobacterium NaphS2]|nr:amino acid or sugar ABC transport system, permease protein [delta proteobacterium NaphS2]